MNQELGIDKELPLHEEETRWIKISNSKLNQEQAYQYATSWVEKMNGMVNGSYRLISMGVLHD
jgi:hypothetical protein